MTYNRPYEAGSRAEGRSRLILSDTSDATAWWPSRGLRGVSSPNAIKFVHVLVSDSMSDLYPRGLCGERGYVVQRPRARRGLPFHDDDCGCTDSTDSDCYTHTVGCNCLPVFRRSVRRNPEMTYNRPYHTSNRTTGATRQHYPKAVPTIDDATGVVDTPGDTLVSRRRGRARGVYEPARYHR
jgi:hypothetical protein